MFSRRIFVFTVVSLLFLTGCPPKKNAKERIRPGRTALSPTGGKNVNGTINSYSSSNNSTQWGSVTGDGNFNQALYYFAQPALDGAGAEEQLGQVNPTPGNGGGVFFWGNVVMSGGQVDSGQSRIHVEVFDNKVGQLRSDGSRVEQLFMHIGPEQEGFSGVQSTSNGIVFMANYMQILMSGQNQGGQFSGTMYFANQYTSWQYWPLGQFSVPSNGFFINY